MNESNNLPRHPSLEEVKTEKANNGWGFIGEEKLTEYAYSTEEDRFVDIPIQTESDIIKKYSESGKNDVELVLDLNTEKLQNDRLIWGQEQFNNMAKELALKDKQYLVFIRPKKD